MYIYIYSRRFDSDVVTPRDSIWSLGGRKVPSIELRWAETMPYCPSVRVCVPMKLLSVIMLQARRYDNEGNPCRPRAHRRKGTENTPRRVAQLLQQ